MVGPCDVRHMTYAKLDKCALPRASRSLSSLVKNHHFCTPSIFMVVRLPYHIIGERRRDVSRLCRYISSALQALSPLGSQTSWALDTVPYVVRVLKLDRR